MRDIELAVKAGFDAGWTAALGESIALVRSESFQPFPTVGAAVTAMDEIVVALERLQRPPPTATPEARILEFCYGEEAIVEMTDAEVSEVLIAEGIDIKPARARLRQRLADLRAARNKEEATP